MSFALQYPAINAKIKAISSKMLADSDFENLIELDTVQAAFNYLYNNTYYKEDLEELSGKEIHRRQLELNLKKSIISAENFSKKYLGSNSKKFIEHYFKKYEIEDLKIILRTILIENEENYLADNLVYIERNPEIDFQNLVQASSFNDLQSALAGVRYVDILNEYEDQYHKTKNLFPIEMSLDFYYFSTLDKLSNRLSKNDRKFAREIVGTQIDLLNLQWIYRIKRYYNLSAGEILNYIIPFHFRITKEELHDMSQTDKAADLNKFISYTPYKNLLETAIREENIVFERFFLNYILNRVEKIKTSSFFSIANVIAYLYIKEYEVRDIVTIIEGVRYSLAREDIKKYLIREEV